METFTGSIKRITYFNPDNNYSVLRVQSHKKFPDYTNREGLITVVGYIPELGVGEEVQFTGEWVDDPKYGKQLRVEQVQPIVPTNIEGILNYLSSGLVKGIGPRTAQRIVDHFGGETMNILNNNPTRLAEVPGLKSKLAEELARAWDENVTSRQTMIGLQGYGISGRMAARIYNEYGSESLEKVKANPYTLADDIGGIGFIRADTIAQKMGMPLNAPERIRSGLVYTLTHLSNDGHVFVPRLMLLEKARELLKLHELDDGLIGECLDEQLDSERLYAESITYRGRKYDAIYLPDFYLAERRVAYHLQKLLATPSELANSLTDRQWESYFTQQQENSIELTQQQQQAVKMALHHKLSILTGGPGTGKTTTIRSLIGIMDQLNLTYALAAPTGRAAKRINESTGASASTIHRLLGFTPDSGFFFGESTRLEIDMLILDETSMLDLYLFDAVLRALKPNTHLVMVGDVDQLPSVGAGNVLRDLIDSELIYVTRLNRIFRQDEESHITLNAHRINRGERPLLENKSDDFFFFSAEEPENAAELVVDIVVNRIPRKFGYNPLTDIQVISPMYRGQIGVNALNEALQAALNGSSDAIREEKRIGMRSFRPGDKVMQTRNSYDKEIFNGDIGIIEEIDREDGVFYITFDNTTLDYPFQDAEEDLIHAYCISTHRSQGSEYPVIVMPVMTQHYIMLQRNLLYTAITRAKKVAVLVGSRQAVMMAVDNNRVAQRYTGLVHRLQAK